MEYQVFRHLVSDSLELIVPKSKNHMLNQEKTTTKAGFKAMLRIPLACAIVVGSALVFSSGTLRAQDTSKHVPPPPPPPPIPADSAKAAPDQVRFPPPKITKNPPKVHKVPKHKKKDVPPPPPPVEPVRKP